MEYISMEYIFVVTSFLFVLSFIFNLKQRKIIKNLQTTESVIMQDVFYDLVTDLPNRNNIEIIITENIHVSARREKSFHIFAIKALDYKILTHDSFEKSNELSREIADAILSSIRDEDTAARVSDDEYIVVFNEYLEDENHKIPMERIVRSLKSVNISYESVSFPKDGETTDSLLNNALTKLNS